MIEKFLFWITALMPAKAIDLGSKYYIERYHVLTLGRLTVLLHRYLGADGDRHLHDHPHKISLGIPIIGGYEEERLRSLEPDRAHTRMRKIRPWRWNLIRARDFHRIASVKPGTWTLFITWHRFKFWGELKPQITPQPERDYGIKISGFVYEQVLDTSPTNSDWHRFALNGNQLRNKRGTNY